LITTNVWIGALLELLEHFPMIDDPNTPFVDIFLTKNRIWSPAVDFILGVHWEGYHLVHHLFPKLPSWHYAKAHDILMNDPVYSQLDHSKRGCMEMIKQVIADSDVGHVDVDDDDESIASGIHLESTKALMNMTMEKMKRGMVRFVKSTWVFICSLLVNV